MPVSSALQSAESARFETKPCWEKVERCCILLLLCSFRSWVFGAKVDDRLATSLAGCDLYGKVCQALAQAGSDGLSRLSCELQELVDSEEVELSPWEAGA